MPTTPDFPLQVFFDGSCSVCAREMGHYRGKEHGGRLVFVDISAADFRAEPYGIPRESFMYEMHAIDRQRRVYRGVEAFRAIWQAFPAETVYGVLGRVIGLPGVNFTAHLLYHAFARMRKYLPKTKDACTDGVCALRGKKP